MREKSFPRDCLLFPRLHANSTIPAKLDNFEIQQFLLPIKSNFAVEEKHFEKLKSF